MIDSVSEKYKKYIVELKFNNYKKLIVSGMNILNEDSDLLLINEEGKLLMFDEFVQIENYIVEKNITLEDGRNYLSWVKKLNFTKPFVSYNLEKIEKELSINKTRNTDEEIFSQIYDVINIIADYCYQINDKYLISLIEAESIIFFNEWFMDTYVWREEGNKSVAINFDQFKKDFRELLTIMYENYVEI